MYSPGSTTSGTALRPDRPELIDRRMRLPHARIAWPHKVPPFPWLRRRARRSPNLQLNVRQESTVSTGVACTACGGLCSMMSWLPMSEPARPLTGYVSCLDDHVSTPALGAALLLFHFGSPSRSCRSAPSCPRSRRSAPSSCWSSSPTPHLDLALHALALLASFASTTSLPIVTIVTIVPTLVPTVCPLVVSVAAAVD